MQYLDDLEDFVYAFALTAERIRHALKALALLLVSMSLQVLTVMLALVQPPLALAIVCLLSVSLLYRAVVNHPNRAATTR